MSENRPTPIQKPFALEVSMLKQSMKNQWPHQPFKPMIPPFYLTPFCSFIQVPMFSAHTNLVHR